LPKNLWVNWAQASFNPAPRRLIGIRLATWRHVFKTTDYGKT
jgi:hypothetical protein